MKSFMKNVLMVTLAHWGTVFIWTMVTVVLVGGFVLTYLVSTEIYKPISANTFHITPHQTMPYGNTGQDKYYVTSQNYYDYRVRKINILSAHVIDNIEISKTEGIFHTGGYLKQAKPYQDEPYYRNQISQYLVFAWIANFVNDSEVLYNYISKGLSALFSLCVAVLVLLVYKKFDFITSLFLLYGILGTNYLIYFSNSFYFMGFSYLLPLIIVMWLYKPFINEDNTFDYEVAIKIGVGVGFVCFLRGMLIFEHISVIISSAVIPIFMLSNSNFLVKVKESTFVILAGVSGFFLSIVVHIIRLWAHLGSVDMAFKKGFETLTKHTGIAEALIFKPGYWISWDGSFSSQLFTFHNVMTTFNYTFNLHNILLIVCLLLVVYFLISKKYTLSDNRMDGMLLAMPFALLSSLSWGIVMSHHNSLPYHLTINSITLTVPFAIVAYMVIGRLMYNLTTPIFYTFKSVDRKTLFYFYKQFRIKRFVEVVGIIGIIFILYNVSKIFIPLPGFVVPLNITDSNWDKGISINTKYGAVLVVENNEVNKLMLQVGGVLISHSSTEFRIINISFSPGLMNVFLDYPLKPDENGYPNKLYLKSLK